MKIEYITHASLLFQSGDVSLLTDPFYFFDDLIASFICHFPDRKLSPDYFPRLDYVYCSHVHDDHCHKKTMLLLKNKIGTIVLPHGKKDLEAKIRSYGFNKLIFLENEKTLTLPEHVSLTAFHDGNGVDTALLVEMEGKTFLHQNDCRLDAAAFTRMAKRFKVDWAFVPHTGNQELFPLLLPRPDKIWRELSFKREESGIKGFIDCIKILKPRLVIPYSFTVAYHNQDQLHLNGYNRTTPVEFVHRVQKEIPHQKCRVIQPGDVLDTEQLPDQDFNKTAWGSSLDDYLTVLRAYCLREHRNSHFDFGDTESVEEEFLRYWKSRFVFPFPGFLRDEKVLIHIQGKSETRSYLLDVSQKTVTQGVADGVALLEITIPASIVAAFLSKRYDSFMILYSYRIRFELNAPLNLTDEEECDLYIVACMSLFDYETYEREMVHI